MYIYECENMAKLVCGASYLKSDDIKFKNGSFFSKTCDLCENTTYENVRHIVMECHGTADLRYSMFNELNQTEQCHWWRQIDPSKALETLLGGNPCNFEFRNMLPIWCVSMKWVNQMYKRVVRSRSGIG